MLGTIHAEKLLSNIEKFNKRYAQKPAQLVPHLSEERDRAFYTRLLDQSQLKELAPAIQMSGVIRHRVGEDTIEYDAYSIVDREIRINERPLTLAANEPLSQIHKKVRMLLVKSRVGIIDLIISKAMAAVDPADVLTLHVAGIVKVNLSFGAPENKYDYAEELFKRLNQDIDHSQASCDSTLSGLMGAKSVSIDANSVELLGKLGVSYFDEPANERLVNVFLARSLKSNARKSDKYETNYQGCEDFKSQVIAQREYAQSESEMKRRSELHGDVCAKMKKLSGCLKEVYVLYEDNKLARGTDAVYTDDTSKREPGKVIEFGRESGLEEGLQKTISK